MRPPTAKLLDRLIVLAATLILTARQYSLPNEQLWIGLVGGRSYILLILLTIIAIFGAFTPFQDLATRRLIDRRSAIRQQVLVHYGQMLKVSQRIRPPLDLADLGLHVWRIRRSFRHPLKGHLKRVATYRLGSAPTTRAFAPPKGVGVVGLCWERNEEVHVDVAAIASACPTEAEYEAFRAREGDAAVMRFPWKEFQRLKHRGAVFASPIRNGHGKFIGCVSVDASHGFTTLDTRAFWREINQVCVLIGHDRFRSL
ncbi:hypothetical protein [Micromonospora zhanjiangensis]|uniref:GAF domain-containing protein n=1 Tax=Micromonospora zhanjiangensis TaxID=1522057 RepID=A0ABV8KTX6_9ACTN